MDPSPSSPAINRPAFTPTLMTRALGWLLLAGIVAAALAFALQRVERGAMTPTAAPLDAAVAILTEELQQDDAMAFLPSWSATQRWRFEQLWRDRNLDFPSAWMPGAPIDAWDADGFKRLWVLSSHGADKRLNRAAVGQLLREEPIGQGMKLMLFQLRPSRTRYDLRLQIADADVRRIGPKLGVEERCRADGDVQRCKGAWWTSVSSGIHEVGNSRRRCLFVQPHPASATLRMRWAKVPEGEELAGRVGNRLWAVRYDEGSDVRFTVRVAGKIRHTQQLARGDFRWHPWRIALRADERGKPVTLEFAATDPTWRQLCVDARVLGPAARP